VRVYVQDPDGRKPQLISPEGVLPSSFAVSPDGKEVAAVGPDGKVYSYPIEGGEPRPIPGSGVGERPISWSADGRFLYLYLVWEKTCAGHCPEQQLIARR
jgi:sugar lactone lactonase YvrE